MRYIYIGLGFLFLGLGTIGIILPVLPTTPFLLIASYCFTKGSDKYKVWFMGTKIYKNHLEEFLLYRMMTLKSKILILSFATSMLMISFFLLKNIFLKIAIILLILFVYYYFTFRIQTVKKSLIKKEFNKERVQ